jgi:hypothetical protein
LALVAGSVQESVNVCDSLVAHWAPPEEFGMVKLVIVADAFHAP